MITGDRMETAQAVAKEIGLVWRVVEAEELQAEAMAWARTLTRAAPLAARSRRRFSGDKRAPSFKSYAHGAVRPHRDRIARRSGWGWARWRRALRRLWMRYSTSR